MKKILPLIIALIMSVSAVQVFAASNINIDTLDNNADIYAQSSVSLTSETIEKITIVLNGEDVEKTMPYALNELEDGKTYTLKNADKTYKLHIDNTDPSITSTLESGTYKATSAEFTVQGAKTDGIQATFKKDNNPIEVPFNNGKATLNMTEDGVYDVRIIAEDEAGNQANKSYKYTISNKAPKIVFTGLDNTIQNSDYDITVTVTAQGFAPITSKTATLKTPSDPEGSEVDISKHIKVSEEGDYELTVSAEDAAGNSSSETKNFTIDKTLPGLNITGVEDKQITNQNITYSVSSDDPNATVITTINGQTVDNEGTLVEENKYTLVATAIDSAGNRYSETIHFEIDKTKPVIQISGINDHDIVNKTVNYTITADGNLTAQITGQTKSGTVEQTKTGKNTITGSLSENGIYTISVSAVDDAGNVADPKTITFTIDKTVPEITITGLEHGKYYNNKKQSFTYEVTAKDTSDVTGETSLLTPEVTIDNQPVSTSGNIDSLNDGGHTLKATVKDAAGNTAEKSISFETDTVAPEASYNDLTCVNDLKKISANATDKNLVDIKLEANCEAKPETAGKYTATATSGPINLSKDDSDEAKDDIWEFTITARDKAGNITTLPKKIHRDTTAPVISLDKVDRYINKNVTIDASSSDPNPKSTKLFIDKDGNERESELKTTLSAEGTYICTVKAVDQAGNESEKSIKFTIDKTPPKVTLTAPSGHNRSVDSVSAKSNEDGKTYLDVTCDGKSMYSGNSEDRITFSKLNKDGEYVVTSYAYDLAGNKSAVETAKFIIDSTAPVVKLSGIENGKFSNRAVTITADVNERFYSTNDVTFTYNGTRIPFNSSGINSKTSRTFDKDGVYEIKLFAKDKAGNTSNTQTLKFTVDTKKPEITISAPAIATYDTIVAPKVTIKDEYFKSKDISLTKNINYKDSFGKTGGTRSYVDFPKIRENDGIYTLSVKATDEAGNVATETKTITVNRFGSVFKVKKKPSDYSKKPDSDVVIIEKNVSDIDSYKVKIFRDAESFDAQGVKVSKNGNLTTYTIPKSNFEKDGVYKVIITTKDKAGNTSKSKGDFNFVIDNAQPVITYKGIDPNTTYQESKVKVYVTATDTLTETPSIKVTSGTKELKLKKDDGGQYFEVEYGYNQDIKITATDKAGNVATSIIENVSVSTSKLAPILAHKKIAIGVLAALIAGITGLIIFLATRKKKEQPDGDDIIM